MKKCTCHICTTSVADLIMECFVNYLLGGITIDQYVETAERLKAEAKRQRNAKKCDLTNYE